MKTAIAVNGFLPLLRTFDEDLAVLEAAIETESQVREQALHNTCRVDK